MGPTLGGPCTSGSEFGTGRSLASDDAWGAQDGKRFSEERTRLVLCLGGRRRFDFAICRWRTVFPDQTSRVFFLATYDDTERGDASSYYSSDCG